MQPKPKLQWCYWCDEPLDEAPENVVERDGWDFCGKKCVDDYTVKVGE